jgi:hypothetical protein
LIDLDRALIRFCSRRDAKWFRYVDDVKVFTKSERDAREAVFVINDALRALHLNLQGSKTDILSGDRLKYELDTSDFDLVNGVFDEVKNLQPEKSDDRKQIRDKLKRLGSLKSQFTKKVLGIVARLDGKKNRLLRRLMTVYGHCKHPECRRTALAVIPQLPDMRLLHKALSYLSQLEISTHYNTVEHLIGLL